MKVFLSGPMRRRPLYGHAAFHEAATALRAAGHTVINPHDLDREAGFDVLAWTPPDGWDWSQVPPGFDLDAAHKRCLDVIRECDGVALLEGWQDSEGARNEAREAMWRGLIVGAWWAFLDATT